MGSYDMTIGVLLVSIFFNTFLYGLVTYQFAAYYLRKFSDPPTTRFMVLFLFILDTFYSASVIYMAWSYTVTDFDKPGALAVIVWPHALGPLTTVLAALVTQIWLGVRIWRLTKRKILYGVVIVLAITSFVLGIACSVDAWTIKVFDELPRTTPILVSWLIVQVTVDMFITITLVLLFARWRTGSQRTDMILILNRLIRTVTQTGFFASLFSVASLFTFVLLPDQNLYAMFCISLGRIYTNTLLDTLLARRLPITEEDEVEMLPSA